MLLGDRGLVPAGLRLRPDSGTRLLAGDAVLVGGSPVRVLRLTSAGGRSVEAWFAGAPVPDGAAARSLARRLLDAGIAHPEFVASPVLASPVLARTVPAADRTRGSSLTATTAANPTPNRPTVPPTLPPTPAPASPPAPASRLLDARSVDSASTPAASSGAPVLAAVSIPSRNVSRSRPGTPARTAASAAFCASSTTTRSRYPPSA